MKTVRRIEKQEVKHVEKRGGGRKKAYGEETAEKIIEYAEDNRNATARGIAKNDKINKNGLSLLHIR